MLRPNGWIGSHTASEGAGTMTGKTREDLSEELSSGFRDETAPRREGHGNWPQMGC